MKIRSTMLAAALLALCLPLAAAPARAATGVSLQINLGSSSHWVAVPGTRVREVRMEDRTDYDVFLVSGRYYAYDHNSDRWYVSRRGNGRYRLIDERNLPRELRRVPRDHWRNYPTEWERSSGRGDYRTGSSGSGIQISFGTSPQWVPIQDSGVQVMYVSGNPDYDVFHYGQSYYAYDGARWYSSTSPNARFVQVDASAVPDVFVQVPRDRWHHAPPAWGNRGNGRGNSEGHRRDGR